MDTPRIPSWRTSSALVGALALYEDWERADGEACEDWGGVNYHLLGVELGVFHTNGSRSAEVSALVEVRDGSGTSHDALRGTW